MKKRGWWLCVILFVLFILSNSLATSDQSSRLSLPIAQTVHQFFSNLSIPIDFELLCFLIRKVAHFSEYALLGILLSLAFYFQPLPHFLALSHKMVFFLIPLVDETLQRFSHGRSSEIRDMLIDSCGMATGMILTFVLLNLFLKKTKENK